MSDPDMLFEEVPDLVWFSIGGIDREPYSIREIHANFVGRFQKWLAAENLWPYKTTTTGGGMWHGAFFKEDAARVKSWLLENGAKPGSYRDRTVWDDYEQMGG